MTCLKHQSERHPLVKGRVGRVCGRRSDRVFAGQHSVENATYVALEL